MPNPLSNIYNSNNMNTFSRPQNQNNGLNENGVNLFKRLSESLNSSQDKNASLMQLAQMNPQFANVIQMCQGKDPRELFIQGCRERGLDPNELMNKLGLK